MKTDKNPIQSAEHEASKDHPVVQNLVEAVSALLLLQGFAVHAATR
ncbi:hypothetical protein [Fodinicurvata sediminis]|nr:hypothetical protein [Fodinicurvata sediminis]